MSGLRIATPVSVIDVAPTILDVLGMRVPDSMQGRSLRGALAGEPLAPRPTSSGGSSEHNRRRALRQLEGLRERRAPSRRRARPDPLERRVRTADVIPPKLATMLQGYDAETAERRARLDEKAAPAAVCTRRRREPARSAAWNSDARPRQSGGLGAPVYSQAHVCTWICVQVVPAGQLPPHAPAENVHAGSGAHDGRPCRRRVPACTIRPRGIRPRMPGTPRRRTARGPSSCSSSSRWWSSCSKSGRAVRRSRAGRRDRRRRSRP